MDGSGGPTTLVNRGGIDGNVQLGNGVNTFDSASFVRVVASCEPEGLFASLFRIMPTDPHIR
jgi:hypothetical protein